MRGEDFFSTSFQKVREEKKARGRDSERAAPCSQHAVIISLCGGELYCFPLVLSQSNNLFCCPCSISSDSSLLYGCYCMSMDVSGQSVQCSGRVSQRSVSLLVEAGQFPEAA